MWKEVDLRKWKMIQKLKNMNVRIGKVTIKETGRNRLQEKCRRRRKH